MVERHEPLAPDPENQVLPAQLTLVGWRANVQLLSGADPR